MARSRKRSVEGIPLEDMERDARVSSSTDEAAELAALEAELAKQGQ